MKFLFQKAPYWGWLILFALLLSGAAIIYQAEQDNYKPVQLAKLVEDDFNRREASILADYNNGAFFKYPDAVGSDESSPDFYLLHIYKNGSITYWNSNLASIPYLFVRNPAMVGDGVLIHANNRQFYLKKFATAGDTSTVAFTLVPLATDYAVKNKFFSNSFTAGPDIPEGTTLAEEADARSIAIKNAGGKKVFYINFTENLAATYTPGIWLCLFFFVSALCFCIWFHKICIVIGKWKYPIIGWAVLFLTVVIFIYNYQILYDLPFNIRNTELFSPKLLSSGESVKSFGDLILFILADAWIYGYLFLNVPLHTVKISRFKIINILAGGAFAYFVIRDIFVEQMAYMQLLITDSKIPFEVTDFSNINIYTFIGLFTAAVVTFNIILLLCIYTELSKTLSSRWFIKYSVLIAFGLYTLFANEAVDGYGISILGSAVCGLFLIERLGFPMRPIAQFIDVAYSPSAYIWFAVICAWVTVEVYYFNYNKEKELRKVYAQKLEQRQDIEAEFAFAELQFKIASDSTLVSYLKKPTAGERININKHLSHEYLSTPFKKYRSSIYLYDNMRNPLFNTDTADRSIKRIADSIRVAQPEIESAGLVYLGNNPERCNYWATIAIATADDTVGFMDIAMSPAQRVHKLNDPLYLKSNYSPADQQYFDKYVDGIYRSEKLESGDNLFPYKLAVKPSLQNFIFKENLNHSTLYYRAANDEVIGVAYKRRLVLNIVSLFSYVLGIVVFISICYFLLRNVVLNPIKGLAIWRRFNFTIRAKVNITILVTVFLSFVVLGIVTVSYLISRYRENQETNLRNAISYVTNSVVKSIENIPAGMTPELFTEHIQRPEYAYELGDIAEGQNVNVNIYTAQGLLRATSQQDFNQKGYMSRIMNRNAFDVMSKERRLSFTQLETTGDLQYQSSYTAILNNRGIVLGYVNVPYYTSQGELQDEISNILAVLINLYTIIFFLSGLSAILVSNNVIKSFNLLIEQFKIIRLRHNEPLQWPYKDEIGMLVNEYNAMIQKVEGMATRLANSEREAAWREIAKQIAHEIKNPLTPMKLQIQYLQQAINNGRQDITPLTSRVTTVLLEQIEHLSIIASEFSNFAKLPEANPENLDALTIVQSVTDLYKNHESVKVANIGTCESLMVWIDKSYLIRILTNIIQNAVQAIPDNREGLVEVSCGVDGQYGMIIVKDNGTGITDEVRSKLFLPNFTTKSSGSGLGLSMTKNMIELSNGSILVDTQLGLGSTFVIRIPLAHNA